MLFSYLANAQAIKLNKSNKYWILNSAFESNENNFHAINIGNATIENERVGRSIKSFPFPRCTVKNDFMNSTETNKIS